MTGGVCSLVMVDDLEVEFGRIVHCKLKTTCKGNAKHFGNTLIALPVFSILAFMSLGPPVRFSSSNNVLSAKDEKTIYIQNAY